MHKLGITAFTITYNALYCLHNALASVRDHVDDIWIGVDSRTKDGTRAYLTEQGIKWKEFVFQDDFSAAWNTVLDEVNGDWALVIPSDEVYLPIHIQMLRAFALDPSNINVDAVYTSRRTWYDLDMANEKKECWPDTQVTMFKSHFRYHGFVHESPGPFTKVVHKPDIERQHFNAAYSDVKKQPQIDELYARLEVKQKKVDPDFVLPRPLEYYRQLGILDK